MRDVLAPFVFLGRHNWVAWNTVLRPRPLGGLGLISSENMAVAITGKMAADLFLRDDALGVQFRAALHDYTQQACLGSPAHFLLQHGVPYRKLANRHLAQGSFLGQVAWALTKLRVGLQPQ